MTATWRRGHPRGRSGGAGRGNRRIVLRGQRTTSAPKICSVTLPSRPARNHRPRAGGEGGGAAPGHSQWGDSAPSSVAWVEKRSNSSGRSSVRIEPSSAAPASSKAQEAGLSGHATGPSAAHRSACHRCDSAGARPSDGSVRLRERQIVTIVTCHSRFDGLRTPYLRRARAPMVPWRLRPEPVGASARQ